MRKLIFGLAVGATIVILMGCSGGAQSVPAPPAPRAVGHKTDTAADEMRQALTEGIEGKKK